MQPHYLIIPLFALATALIGSVFTSGNMSWYRTIRKPEWTPGGQLIGTVWTVLFTLTAISAILAWNATTGTAALPIIMAAFVANAALNVLWSFLFFSLHQMRLAIFECALLGISVLALIILIWPASVPAALLLVPYGLWVSFATFLTWSVWRENRAPRAA